MADESIPHVTPLIFSNVTLDDINNKTPKYIDSIWFDEEKDDIYIKIRWKYGRYDKTEKLSVIIDTHESYLYDVIPWISSNINPENNNNDKRIQEYINTVWVSTTPTMPVGTIVEIQNGNYVNYEYKYGIIESHNNVEISTDFAWNLYKYNNIDFLPIDTRKTFMDTPTAPFGISKIQLPECDLARVELESAFEEKQNDNVDIDSLSFDKRYFLLKMVILNNKNTKLERQKYRAEHTAEETVSKQLEILARRAASVMRLRTHGDTVSICIAYNANMFILFTLKTLKEHSIDVNKRGYVYSAKLSQSEMQRVFGNQFRIEKRTEPDASTLSNGYKLHTKEFELVWSQVSLKLRLRFVVQRTTIKLPKQALKKRK